MKGWVYMALLALLAFNVAQCAVGRESGTAQRNRLAEQKRAAKHTADSLKALLAQERIAGEKADTVYRVARARVPSPDTIRLTDTVRVAQYIARCEDALSACDTLADSYRKFRLLTAEQQAADGRYVTSLQSEVARLRPRAEFGPRVRVYGEGLRDMVSGLPSVAGGAEFRLLGRIYLTGRVEQRLVMGDTVRAYLGVRLVF